jgi:NADH:ubiquinone oxidoreductase subunit F (NADH-binding)
VPLVLVSGGAKKTSPPGKLPTTPADKMPVSLITMSRRIAAVILVPLAAVMVMDEDTSMVDVACNLIGFYHHESCGQCTPCREGTEWMEHILKGFKQGRAVPNDIATLERLFPMIEGKTICPFGEAFVWPVRSLIRKFKAEFEQYIVYKGVPVGVKV